MPQPKKSLCNLHVASLKAFCASCGLPTTGSKSVLIQRLRHAAKIRQPLSPDTRILSIDLGLKNFAFSLLSPAPPQRPDPTSTITSDTIDSPAHLHAWHLLDLTSSSHPIVTTSTPGAEAAAAAAAEAAADRKQDEAEEEEEEGEVAEGKPDYSPAALASLAVALVRTHLLPLRPTHVLIERQRFRTRGGPAVSEWTLRVNSFEAVLYGVFAALRAAQHGPGGDGDGDGAGEGEGKGGWLGEVAPVLPTKVSKFLFPVPFIPEGEGRKVGEGEVEEGKVEEGKVGEGERKGKKGPEKAKKKTAGGKQSSAAAYRMLKQAKMDLLAGWLRSDPGGAGGQMLVPATEQARQTARRFLASRDRGVKMIDVNLRRKHGVTYLLAALEGKKMDDLSDAALQGMVWLQWQRNLERLVEERPDLLDEEGA